jgi:hypothetical protein
MALPIVLAGLGLLFLVAGKRSAPPAAAPVAAPPAGSTVVTLAPGGGQTVAATYGSALVIYPPPGSVNFAAGSLSQTPMQPGVYPTLILAPAPFDPGNGGAAFVVQARGPATVDTTYQDASGRWTRNSLNVTAA